MRLVVLTFLRLRPELSVMLEWFYVGARHFTDTANSAIVGTGAKLAFHPSHRSDRRFVVVRVSFGEVQIHSLSQIHILIQIQFHLGPLVWSATHLGLLGLWGKRVARLFSEKG